MWAKYIFLQDRSLTLRLSEYNTDAPPGPTHGVLSARANWRISSREALAARRHSDSLLRLFFSSHARHSTRRPVVSRLPPSSRCSFQLVRACMVLIGFRVVLRSRCEVEEQVSKKCCSCCCWVLFSKRSGQTNIGNRRWDGMEATGIGREAALERRGLERITLACSAAADEHKEGISPRSNK